MKNHASFVLFEQHGTNNYMLYFIFCLLIIQIFSKLILNIFFDILNHIIVYIFYFIKQSF